MTVVSPNRTILSDQPERADLVTRFFALQPALRQRLAASLPHDLRDEMAQVTLHQVEAIKALAGDGLPMHEFAQTLAVTMSAATQLADRLVKQGLAERHTSSEDRRLVRLTLTGRARSLLGRYQQARQGAILAAFAALSTAELATLIDLLEKLASPAPTHHGEE